jgi:hypothetical protein
MNEHQRLRNSVSGTTDMLFHCRYWPFDISRGLLRLVFDSPNLPESGIVTELAEGALFEMQHSLPL